MNIRLRNYRKASDYISKIYEKILLIDDKHFYCIARRYKKDGHLEFHSSLSEDFVKDYFDCLKEVAKNYG